MPCETEANLATEFQTELAAVRAEAPYSPLATFGPLEAARAALDEGGVADAVAALEPTSVSLIVAGEVWDFVLVPWPEAMTYIIDRTVFAALVNDDVDAARAAAVIAVQAQRAAV